MINNSSNDIQKYFNSILHGDNIKNSLYKKLISNKYNNNKNCDELFKKRIYDFQKQNTINEMKNYYMKFFETKEKALNKIEYFISKFKRKKRIFFSIEKKKFKINKSIDIYIKNKNIDRKKSKNLFLFLKLHDNIKYAIKNDDKNNIFKELIYILFEFFLKMYNNKNKINLLRRKSFNKKCNYKEIKLSNIRFEDYLYDLIIKLQIKKGLKLNEIYIPWFLKNIKNFQKCIRTRKNNPSLIEINKLKIKFFFNNIKKNKKFNTSSLNNINLIKEVSIYNLLVNFIKNYYKLDEFLLNYKNVEDVKKETEKIKENKEISQFNKYEEKLKNSEKFNLLKKCKNNLFNKIELLYSKSKINKINKFSKIIKKNSFYKKYDIFKTSHTNKLTEKNYISKQKLYSLKRYSITNFEKLFDNNKFNNNKNNNQNNNQNKLKLLSKISNMNKSKLKNKFQKTIKKGLIKNNIKKKLKIKFKSASSNLNQIYKIN